VRIQPARDPTRYESNLPELFRLIRPLVGEESDKCGIMAALGEDVAWDEAWESLWAREYLMEWALV
jgi:hypothetical protein